MSARAWREDRQPVAQPLTFVGESATLGPTGARLTLVAGSAFCISAASGDIMAARPHGLFFRDTRFISTLRLLVDGEPPELLATIPDGLQAATIVLRHVLPV